LGILNDTDVSTKSPTDTDRDETLKHQCLNSDFNPEQSKAVWTMINDNMDYASGAIKVGRGVKNHTKTPVDLVVMELKSKPISDEIWVRLREVGYKRCIVEPIPPPNKDKTRADLREKFAVLRVWAMTVYDTVLFLDADTFVRNSLDSLINMNLKNKTIGVAKDIRNKVWVETFNSGVLLLHPRESEFERLVQLLRSGIEFEYIMSDQGFLNVVYKNDWHDIGFVNNANLALYRFQRKFWDQHQLSDINIIHYTMEKPWKCNSQDNRYGPICAVWQRIE